MFEVYVDPPDDRYHDVCASTVLLSHRMREFNTTPYVFLYGPPGSGKTRVLDIFNFLCFNPLFSSSMSPASIYQSINKWHPTLLIDETDRWKKAKNDEGTLATLQILNSGYRRNQKVVRASREGTDPILYDVFGLKVIAGTEPLPRTLADRTIRLDMEKNVKDIPLDLPRENLRQLRGQLERYQLTYALGRVPDGCSSPGSMKIDVDPEDLKETIRDNRVTELIYPLYAVCPTVDGRRNLTSLAKEAVANKEEDGVNDDLAEVLLAVWKERTAADPDLTKDVRWLQSTEQGPPFRIELDALKSCTFETKPEKDNTAQWLGWRLRKLQFKRARIDGVRYVQVENRKLYRAMRRYLPGTLPTSATLETSASRETSSKFPSTTMKTASARVQADVADVTNVRGDGSNGFSDAELRLVRKALLTEMSRVGYAQDALLTYRVKEQIPDVDRLSRILHQLELNGEIAREGTSAWKTLH